PGSRSEVKDLEVVTEIACYSRWCGSVPAVDAEHPAWLFVLKVSDPSVVYQGPPHSISFPPCTDSVFAPPPAAELDAFSAGWTR
ncbi:MAG: hypothetical protein KC656_26455, partial [Myxococcales bacterium]|nr:hypothetical protein [Myxococcales bacterium]